MKLHDLQPAPGSRKDRKRLGRGNASGQGTTAGKGTKGEKARSGGLRSGFRGMSSRNQRLAKRRGFNNKWRTESEILHLSALARFDSGAAIDLDSLQEAGLVSTRVMQVKVLSDGEISVPIHLTGLKVSSAARQKIEAAGGTVIVPAPGNEQTATEENSGDSGNN